MKKHILSVLALLLIANAAYGIVVNMAGNKYVGLSSDTKSPLAVNGSIFYETDTRTQYLKQGGGWTSAGGSWITGIWTTMVYDGNPDLANYATHGWVTGYTAPLPAYPPTDPTTKYLRGDGGWATPSPVMPPDGNKGDITTANGWGSLTINSTSVTEAMFNLSDNTTGDFTTVRHGLVPKGAGGASNYLHANGGFSPINYGDLTNKPDLTVYTTSGQNDARYASIAHAHDLSSYATTGHSHWLTGLLGGLAPSQLPLPSATTIGGLKAITCTGSDKISVIGTDGVPVCSVDEGGLPAGGSKGDVTVSTGWNTVLINSGAVDYTEVANTPDLSVYSSVGHGHDLSNYATKGFTTTITNTLTPQSWSSTNIDARALKATTLAGYGITDGATVAWATGMFWYSGHSPATFVGYGIPTSETQAIGDIRWASLGAIMQTFPHNATVPISGQITATSMPAAKGWLTGATTLFNFQNAKQIRLIAKQWTTAFANAKVFILWSTNRTSWQTMTLAHQQATLTQTADYLAKLSTWDTVNQNMKAAGDVWIGLWFTGGDGTISPGFGGFDIEVLY